jgi:hypothetical protein
MSGTHCRHGEVKEVYGIFSGNLKGRDHLKALNMDEKIILK